MRMGMAPRVAGRGIGSFFVPLTFSISVLFLCLLQPLNDEGMRTVEFSQRARTSPPLEELFRCAYE